MTMTLMSLKAVGRMQVRCCIKAQLNSSHPCCAEGALVVLETIWVHSDDSEAMGKQTRPAQITQDTTDTIHGTQLPGSSQPASFLKCTDANTTACL